MNTVQLETKELRLIEGWARQREAEMSDSPDKAGSLRKGEFHTTFQSEALSIMGEYAACKYLGANPLDRKVWVPFAKKVNGRLPAECKQPDIYGKYEIRRVEDASSPIKMWPKDHEAGAYVLQCVVQHEHKPNGKIVPSGLVTFTSWCDAGRDWSRKHFYEGYYFYTFAYRRPMASLPRPGVS